MPAKLNISPSVHRRICYPRNLPSNIDLPLYQPLLSLSIAIGSLIGAEWHHSSTLSFGLGAGMLGSQLAELPHFRTSLPMMARTSPICVPAAPTMPRALAVKFTMCPKKTARVPVRCFLMNQAHRRKQEACGIRCSSSNTKGNSMR